MADYTSVNGVAEASITSVNGVAKASIASINGTNTPSSDSRVWVAGQDKNYIAYATTDLTSWVAYDARSGGSDPDFVRVAYGKDGSGNPMWCGNLNASNAEVTYTSDPTDEQFWTTVNLTVQGRDIQWGNDYWIYVGVFTSSNKLVYRSSDGSTWNSVDVSGATSISTNNVTSLASDGAGTWWFGQQCRIYRSTDDGASWALHHTLTGCGEIDDLAYTNNTLVCLANGKLYSAASTDTTDWSASSTLTSGGNATRMAAAGGRVVVAYSGYAWPFDVNGKTITAQARVDISGDAHGGARCIGTDGTTWLIGCETGDIFSSTDDGATWTAEATNVGPNKDIDDIKANVYLPL